MRLSPVAPVWVLIFTAEGLEYAGLYEEAVELAEKVLEDPDLSTFNRYWARVPLMLWLAAPGRDEEARQHLAAAVDLLPGFANIAYQANDGRRYIDQKYVDETMATWRRLGMPEE
jgi:tetratricopeptide (TPR) repeat protein